MTIVWIYVDTRYRVGHPITSRSSPTRKPPSDGSRENDPEGVAFQYKVIEE